MKDITNDFGRFYHPMSALIFYQSKGRDKDSYVEFFDMDTNGNPVNAHPLTIKEANKLSKALRIKAEKQEPFLIPTNILTTNILYLNSHAGKAIWHTKMQQRVMYFKSSLGIRNGKANVPPMLWVGDRYSLSVFALSNDRRPTEKTILYDAPFFNIYKNGEVCMGSVDVNIKRTTSLEEFTNTWEFYFFNSYFSHLMEDYNPVNGNCVTLWESLVNTEREFPMDILRPNKTTLKNLIP